LTEYITKIFDKINFEKHNFHIDFHLILEGKEKVYINDLISNQYIQEDYKNDRLTFKSKKKNKIVLQKNDFIVIYPHEYHQPNVKVFISQKVKKLVFKIKIK
jgi:YhcH/YjgK/YiaL family protein